MMATKKPTYTIDDFKDRLDSPMAIVWDTPKKAPKKTEKKGSTKKGKKNAKAK